MLEKPARVFEDTMDDIGYIAKRSLTFVIGKQGGQQAGMLAGGAIGALAGGGGETAQLIAANGVAASAVAGVSAYLVQKDFLHKREELVRRYREEVGTLLDKAPDKVQQEDLALIARGDFKKGIPANPSVRRELKNSWLIRNVNFVLATAVSVITFAAVHAADHYLGGGAALEELYKATPDIVPTAAEIQGALAQSWYTGVEALTHGSNMFSTIANAVTTQDWGQLASIGQAVGINGVIGLATYHGLKTPAHWAASDVLGIDEHTVNDRITDIKRTLGHGREVQPEQVLGLFIHAHNDINEQIEAEYGKSFDRMTRGQQMELLHVVEDYMDVRKLTDNINHGRMRPEELIFAAYGQKSGMEIAQEGRYQNHGNVLDGMWRGLQAVTGGYQTTDASKAHMAKVSSEIANELPGETEVTLQTKGVDDASLHLENTHEAPGKKQSFVAKVGRSVDRSADGLSHVERLSQSSTQETLVTPT